MHPSRLQVVAGRARATAALPVPFDVANAVPDRASSGAGTIDFGFTALYDVAGERMSKILACLNPAVAAGQLGSGATPGRSSMSSPTITVRRCSRPPIDTNAGFCANPMAARVKPATNTAAVPIE